MLRDPTPQFMLDTIQGLRNQRLSGENPHRHHTLDKHPMAHNGRRPPGQLPRRI